MLLPVQVSEIVLFQIALWKVGRLSVSPFCELTSQRRNFSSTYRHTDQSKDWCTRCKIRKKTWRGTAKSTVGKRACTCQEQTSNWSQTSSFASVISYCNHFWKRSPHGWNNHFEGRESRNQGKYPEDAEWFHDLDRWGNESPAKQCNRAIKHKPGIPKRSPTKVEPFHTKFDGEDDKDNSIDITEFSVQIRVVPYEIKSLFVWERQNSPFLSKTSQKQETYFYPHE